MILEGKIRGIDTKNGVGTILAEDGLSYGFLVEDLPKGLLPDPGMPVYFEPMSIAFSKEVMATSIRPADSSAG